MAQVQTVLGPVDAAALGRVLMHEHIFVLTADVQQNYPEEWGSEDDRVADAVARLKALAAAGIKTIVDVTVIGQGRYIPRIKLIAEQVPELNIVVAAGCYTFDEVPMFFWRRTPGDEALAGRPARDPMQGFFTRDITDGITGTGVRAGMLKCAVDAKGLTKGVERVLRNVARAHVATGTPITIHTHAAARHGPAILAVLHDEGADLDRVVLGHSGDAVHDPDYLEEMARSGLTLGMDRFGIDHFATFQERCDLVVELCRRGLAGRMVLSHDACCHIDWFSPGSLAPLKDWHYLHVSQDVLPYLRAHGVPEADIDAMLIAAPARVLAGSFPQLPERPVLHRAPSPDSTAPGVTRKVGRSWKFYADLALFRDNCVGGSACGESAHGESRGGGRDAVSGYRMETGCTTTDAACARP